MLNIFPLTFLSFVAFSFLRAILGGILAYLGYQHLFPRRKTLVKTLRMDRAIIVVLGFGALEIILGGMFIAGAYTQIAALTLMVLSIGMIIFKPIDSPSIPNRLTYILFLSIAITLFITGAGALAFDLPV